MFDRVRTLAFQDACLGTLLLASAAALAQSLAVPLWWALLPCVIALLLRLQGLSAAASRRWARAGRLVIGSSLLFGLAWTLSPVMPDSLVRLAPRLLGGGLVLLACIFYMGPGVWDRSRVFLPTALALLALAAYNPDAQIDPALGIAVAAVFFEFASGRAPRLVVYGVLGVVFGLGIVRFLPWAQPKVEAASVGFLADSTGQTGLSLSDTARLGEVEGLAGSETVALRVWSSEAQRLRARVLTSFDGAAWHARAGAAEGVELRLADHVSAETAAWLEGLPGQTYEIPAPRPTASRATVHSKIVVAGASAPVLLSPRGAVLVRTPVAPARVDALGILTTVGQTSIYGIVNAPLADALEPEPTDDLVALPADTDPRLRTLARALGDGRSPDEKLERTLAHLGRECRYALKVGRFETRQPVAEFLFDKKRGYCEYFASAAAVLLRLEGVPTRFVTGFNVTPANYAGGHYLVRESDAHAWIDAYLAGRGWVEFDPTPADQYSEVHSSARPAVWAVAWEWLRSERTELLALLRSGGVKLVGRRALGPVALVLAAAVRIALRRRATLAPRPGSHARSAVPRALTALLEQVDGEWRSAGFARPVTRAPLEHLEAIPGEGLPVPLREATRSAVDLYYRVRFAGAPLLEAELHALREGLAASRRSLRG
jgi:transglutaminase-like putative cysteine protease